MSSFLIKIFLPYILPILVQGLTPIIVEYVKVAADYLHGKLPAAVNVALAAAVSEGVNQAFSALSGASLPPGVGAIIAILLNELAADFGKQPPTPGVSAAQ